MLINKPLTTDQPPRYDTFCSTTSVVSDSVNSYPGIYLEHKPSRKTSYKLMYLKKKYKLMAGKSSYLCGSTIGSGNVSLEGDKCKNSTMSGVRHCESIHQCRICASKILSQRQLELESINNEHLKNSGSVLLVSLTIKNSKYDTFESLLGSTKNKTGILWAYSNLSYKYKRRFKKLLDLYSVVFSVRVFESTWGVNGFHVHTHSLFYLQRKLSEQELFDFKLQFYKLWKLSLKDVGLTCNFEHGIDVQDGSNAGKYIAKWSGSSELSSAHVKKAKNGNYTIAQLENLLLDESQTQLPLSQVKAVLREYYKGCYKKKFMTWSGNIELKNKYLEAAKVKELSDEECLESSDILSKEKVVIGNITYRNIYIKNQVHELRTSFEIGSFNGVLALAKSLSVSTSDIHYINDSDLTEEQKLKKIDYYIQEFGWFPDFGDDLEKRDYFILNYHNLLNTALYYYADTSTLAPNNAYYVYVVQFCRQYVVNVLNNSL
jgi:hypothetical protein